MLFTDLVFQDYSKYLLQAFKWIDFVFFAGNKEDVLLKVNSFNYEKGSVLLSITVFNNGVKDITCYKVVIHDICTSVLKIKAKDNTVQLSPNEGFVKVIRFAVKDFSPYLKKGS